MLDQYDLFSNTPKTTDVTQKNTSVSTPVTEAVETTIYTPEYELNDRMSLMEFAVHEEHRIWHKGEQHKKRSMAQLGKFADFSNHSQIALGDFRSSHAHAFLDHLAAAGAKRSSQNRYAATISKFFKYAVKTRIIDMPVVVSFHDEGGLGRPRAFSDHEQDQLIQYFVDNGKQWIADMCLVSLRTAMRRGEILALGEGTAFVTPDERWITLPAPYTKTKVERSLPINHPETQAAVRRLCATLKTDHCQKTFYRWWNKARCEIAPGDEHFTFHVCRHTALTRLSDLGTNAFTIA